MFIRYDRPSESSKVMFFGLQSISTLLLLIFVIGLIRADQSCPIGCRCTAENKVECTCGDRLTNIPTTLSPQLRSLSVAGCPFTELTPKQFSRYPLLESLVLQRHEALNKIQPFTFRGLNRLKVLAIRHNRQLGQLTECALGGIHSDGSLQIYLDGNNLTAIEGFVFADTRGIRTIHFGENQIRVIKANAFSGLFNMHTLNLPNGLHRIEPNAFANFTRLHLLDIEQWHAKEHGGVLAHTFKGLRHVSSISIRRSQLGHVHPSAFSGLFVVERVLITDSLIGRLSRKSFASMHNVGRVSFKHNTIELIDRNFFKHLSLEHVVFAHNQLNCTCLNMWLFTPDLHALLPTHFFTDNTCTWPKMLGERSLNLIPKQWTNDCQVTIAEYEKQQRGSSTVHTANYILVTVILAFQYIFIYSLIL